MGSNGAASDCTFFYSVQGQIQDGDFPLSDKLYVKTSYHHGVDWQFRHGIEEGMSQMAVQSHDGSRNFVWNFPIESWWRSCNPHGWPRLILCVYEAGAGNNDIIHGYGSTLLPFCPGPSQRRVAIYRPQSSSAVQQWMSWLSGRRPELIEPKSIACSDGRHGEHTHSNYSIVTHQTNTTLLIIIATSQSLPSRFPFLLLIATFSYIYYICDTVLLALSSSY